MLAPSNAPIHRATAGPQPCGRTTAGTFGGTGPSLTGRFSELLGSVARRTTASLSAHATSWSHVFLDIREAAWLGPSACAHYKRTGTYHTMVDRWALNVGSAALPRAAVGKDPGPRSTVTYSHKAERAVSLFTRNACAGTPCHGNLFFATRDSRAERPASSRGQRKRGPTKHAVGCRKPQARMRCTVRAHRRSRLANDAQVHIKGATAVASTALAGSGPLPKPSSRKFLAHRPRNVVRRADRTNGLDALTHPHLGRPGRTQQLQVPDATQAHPSARSEQARGATGDRSAAALALTTTGACRRQRRSGTQAKPPDRSKPTSQHAVHA